MSNFVGKTIDQYQIVELIEDTGNAMIYKGFQPNMNRYVAVKVLKSQEIASVQRFTQQTELLAQIQHSNILSVIASGQAEGFAYRVFPYIEDGVLRDQLFRYADPRKAAGLMAGIVAGLEKIHAQGIVHSNLGSGNIYLGNGGVPYLTEFGLPKPPGAPLTAYMSPEQTQGGVVDRRTDVYALGVLLYEILVGETPPPGMVISPRSKRPDLPESVEKIIFKAMAQNPDARFQRAVDFQNALMAALQPVVPAQATVSPPEPEKQPSAPPPPPAPQRTNWAAIILGVVLMIVICVGMVLLFSWWSNRDDGIGVPEPTTTAVEIIPTDEPPEPTQEPEATQEPEPTQEPEEPGEPPELPEVCNSTGFIGGFILLGFVLSIHKNKRSTHRVDEKT